MSKAKTAKAARPDETVIRCDPLSHRANAGKIGKVAAVLPLWRDAAAGIAAEQWALFWKTGRFDNQHDVATEARRAVAEARRPLIRLIAERGGRTMATEDQALTARVAKIRDDGGRYKAPLVKAMPAFVDPMARHKEVLGAQRVQMVRYQVVGLLESWLSNRKNEFRKAVLRSSLDDRTRHELLTVNAWNAWFTLDRPVTLKVDGASRPAVSVASRRLARAMMRQIFARHRKPGFARIGMVLDRRAVSWGPARSATAFALWATVQTAERTGKAWATVDVPLLVHDRFTERKGTRALSVQVSEREGRLTFGILTDVTDAFAESRAAYKPETECLALDWGLRTLFATSEGDLVGRGFLAELKRHDRRILKRMRDAQRKKIRPRQHKPYRAAVARMQGFLKTFINLALHRLIAARKPAVLLVERLRFTNPALSKTMNRLLSVAGRKIVQDKLTDLTQRFGIEVLEVNPAYSSQSCPSCGYVDKHNRKNEEFSCRFCGKKGHADVLASRTIRQRRSFAWALAGSGVFQPKQAILAELVRRFRERHPGARGCPGDRVLSNPYFKGDWNGYVVPMSVPKRARMVLLPQAQDLALAEAA